MIKSSSSLVHRGEVRSFIRLLMRCSSYPGTEYGVQDVFDLSVMKPYSLGKIYEAFSKITNTMVLYLPRNSDLNQIARLVPEGKKIEVSHYCIVGASKVSILFQRGGYLTNSHHRPSVPILETSDLTSSLQVR